MALDGIRYLPSFDVRSSPNDGSFAVSPSVSMTFYVDPIVSGVFPPAGPMEGNISANISGRYFRNSSHLSCRFTLVVVPGSAPHFLESAVQLNVVQKAIFISSTTVQCIVPKTSVAGVARIYVLNNGQQDSATFADFTYNVEGSGVEVPPDTLFTVKISIKMPYTKSDFETSKQDKFKMAVSSAAGTSPGNVKIVSITESRRRAGGVEVITKILASDAAGTDAVRSALGTGDALKNNVNQNLIAQGLQASVGVTEPVVSTAAKQTIVTFVDKIEHSEGGNGSYFPAFSIEERHGWPRTLWPRGEAKSRHGLAELASRELDRGATIVVFAGTDCPRCTMILDIFRELDVPVGMVDPAMLDVGLREQVQRELRDLDVTGAKGSDAPAVFLGTRLLGMALEVEAMLYTGELHARLRVYGVLPRSMPPINRAPVVRIQPRATRPEAERLSVAWESSWVHPQVLGQLQVTVVEAKGLTAFSYSYDPVQRKVLRGALPTPGGSVFGTPVSNPFVVLELEGMQRRSAVLRETLEPFWNFNVTFWPVRNINAHLQLWVRHADEKLPEVDPFFHGDPALEMGRVNLRLPGDANAIEHWYSLVGDQPGDRVTGEVKVRLQYTPFYHTRVQAGRRVRIGGLIVQDADVLNGTIRATVESGLGSLRLPSNNRVSWILGEPLTRMDPRDIVNGGSRGTHVGVFFEPPSRIGFRFNDGELDRKVVFEGSLEAVQATLSELEYEAPALRDTDEDAEDYIRVQVNDLGHSGSGGPKLGSCLLNVTVFPGPDNQPPVLHMWPHPASAASTNVDGTPEAIREVPLGEEGAIYGLYVDDDDVFGGRLTVTIVAEIGAVSLRGLGPWSRSAAARASFDDNILDGVGLQIRGRQITMVKEKGFYTRSLICTRPGGFADEFLVQGPLNGLYSVRSNTLPGQAIAGSTAVVRPYTLLAGHCLPLHHDAHADFEVQYVVYALESSARINVLLLDDVNYRRYIRKEYFAYHRDGSILGVQNATQERVNVKVNSPQRWHVVVEETLNLQKPGWRFDQGGGWWEPGEGGGHRADWRQRPGEYETGQNRSRIHLLYHVKFQRSSFSAESFETFTDYNTLDRPSATRVCGWILSAEEEEQYAPPPGTTLLGLEFTQGDGHRDRVMHFSGPLSSVQHALASLSYTSSVMQASDSNFDKVVVSVDDNGHSGAGGPKSASFVIRVKTVAGPGFNSSKLPAAEQAQLRTGGSNTSWVAEVREDNRWLDVVLEQLDIGGRFRDPNSNGLGLGERKNLRSIAVAPGNYSAAGLAAALTAGLRTAYGDFFAACARGITGDERGTSSICWPFSDGINGRNVEGLQEPPIQLGEAARGGAIQVDADEAGMRFTFFYDPVNGAEPVTNGQYINARPCEQGGGPQAVNNSCGWWGGRFSLLFESGPNRERSLALLLGFNPDQDYSSSISQHMGGTLGAMSAKEMPYKWNTERDGHQPVGMLGDNWARAELKAPLHYFRDLGAALPPVLALQRENRAPTLSLPFKTRADIVSVSVPSGSMEGKCRVRDSGVSYAGVKAGVGGLEVEEGVGSLVNRWFLIEEGDVVLRDYRFAERFVPDPARAQWTVEWDHAVVVTQMQLVMTRHGVVEVEALVGGTADAWVGHMDSQQMNQGWFSLGVVNGSAGAGPFSDGVKSIFAWPRQLTDKAVPGRLLRIIVRKVYHQKKWAIYRAFPTWRQPTHVVNGIAALAIESFGSGYTHAGAATASCELANGEGIVGCTGDQFEAVCNADGIASIAVDSGGTGYTDAGEATSDCTGIPKCTGSGFRGTCTANGVASISVSGTATAIYADGGAASASCAGVPNCTGSGFAGTCSVTGIASVGTQQIASVAVSSLGSGYTDNGAALSDCSGIVGCTGTGFAGVCKADGIASVTVIDPGVGYTDGVIASADCSGVPGCTGAGFTGTCNVTAEKVTGITVLTAGQGYVASALPKIKCAQVDGKGFNLDASPSLGAVTAIDITSGGSGYSAAAPPKIICAGGTGLQAVSTFSASGSGYNHNGSASADCTGVAGCTGSGFSGRCMADGIESIAVIAGGTGYVNGAAAVADCAGVPNCTGDLLAFSGTCDVTNGAVTQIRVRHAGKGFLSAALPAIKCAGGIASVSVAAAGSGYSHNGAATAICDPSDPACTGSGFSGTCSADGIASISIAVAGSGYEDGAAATADCSNIAGCTGTDFSGTCQAGGIASISVYAGGTGYLAGSQDSPAVATAECTADCTGSGFAGTCTVEAGVVLSIDVTSPGSGYTAAHLPSIKCPGGAGGQFIPSLGAVTGITITNPGSAYSSSSLPKIVCAVDNGGNGAFDASPTLGAISKIHISSQGTGYSPASMPSITCAGGTGGVLTPTLAGTGLDAVPSLGAVTAITVTTVGSNYSSSALPKILCEGGNSDLGASPALGAVTSVSITSAGAGYHSAALPVIQCAGGAGQALTPSLGAVTSVKVLNAGSGYVPAALPKIKCAGGNGDLVAAALLGAVSGITILNHGRGYSPAALPLIRCPGGIGGEFIPALDGIQVPSHLVRATAGEETPLQGIELDDPDIGQDPVGAYSLDARRLRVEISADNGILFVDAPYVDVEAAGPESGDANRLEGLRHDDAAAQAVQGDTRVGNNPAAEIYNNVLNQDAAARMQDAGIPGNVKIQMSPWQRQQVLGVDSLNNAKWRTLSAGSNPALLYFIQGGGTADRRMIFEGRLSAVQRALRGLRYKSQYSADPAAGAASGVGRMCTHGLMCGQSSGAQSNYLGGYGAAGYDVVTITVNDLGNSERLCEKGGADPLGQCVLEPAAPLQARAVLEVTVRPRGGTSLGQRASDWQDDPVCKPCYQLHPLDGDLCVHASRYWAAPDVPGHAYRLSTWRAYSVAQRMVWDQEFNKPCDDLVRTQWSDVGGDVRLSASSAGDLAMDASGARSFVADSNSLAHGDPAAVPDVDDDLRRFMSSLPNEDAHMNTRPWEGR